MKHTWRTLAALCLLLVTTASSVFVSSAAPTANTNCGPVQGLAKDGAFSFRGIPYAEPPVGTLRWKAPVPLSHQARTCWSGTFPAQTFGNRCFQRDVQNRGHNIGSEDCLYLNVWTPNLNPHAQLTVRVWIHGGSLQFANGNWPTYSPSEKLARETDIVYVSMNYRMHAFGFMALDLLSHNASSGTSGNYGSRLAMGAGKCTQLWRRPDTGNVLITYWS
jgi:para-nitrobenzyl esterase